jgi:hypothetical protein
MSRDVINIDGEPVLVREDTAKAVHGVNWAMISIGAFVLIAAALFVFFFFGSIVRDGSVESPAQQDSNPR